MFKYSVLREKFGIESSLAEKVRELAYFTHYLHNYKNNIPEIFEQGAMEYLHKFNPEFLASSSEIQKMLPIKWDIPFPAPENPEFTFIDLFAGIGGFRIPMQELGGNCVFSSEFNYHAQRAYELNFGEVPFGDITKLNTDIVPKHDILCAGFPCQPFSISGKMKGFEDTRGTLIYHVFEIIEKHQPKVVFLENVKHLVYHDNKKTLATIIQHLEELGYMVSKEVLNASDFGLPQNRERIIIIGHKDKKFDFTKIEKKQKPALKTFLDKDNEFEYLDESYTILEEQKKQDSGLIFAGYRNKSIRKAGVREGTEHLSRVHKQPNRIYSTEGVHPALPSQESSGRFWIWHEGTVRKLTIQECYRIMGFPNKFKLLNNKAELYKQIGNSVAIPMIKAVAEQIKTQLLNVKKMEPTEFLKNIYNESMQIVGSDSTIKSDLNETIANYLYEILSKSESAKGVITVILTSAVYKTLYPEQDIRNHQTSISSGYSGRTFDSKFITPFLKSVKFPAMAESGWLTRSLEQKVPYDLNYSGAIRPASLKTAFLETIAFIQKGEELDKVLSFLFQGLILQRNAQQIDLAKPHNLQIATIIDLLTKHFETKYSAEGASRLPVLALYAAYQCLVNETKRFEGKTLLPMESHTSADTRSGRVGDIDIVDEKEKVFEAVEVKHGIQITTQLVKDAFEKFKTTQVNRYYLLSTANIEALQAEEIAKEIERIKNIHGCHVIANGLTNSLKYYLRLLSDTSEFIENYVNLIEIDTALKFEHKIEWNKIISEM